VEPRKTPLYEQHKILKAKMVPFGDWLMPVSYSGVLAEHKAVRETSGLFDVSHMGEILVNGKGAESFLQKMTINDVTRLKDGSGQYTAILQPDGGMIDDLIIYRLEKSRYFICANASNTDKDYAWLKQQSASFQDVTIVNDSTHWGQLAVQGPKSKTAVAALLPESSRQALEHLNYMEIMGVMLFGGNALLARTGYTGELGYELYLPTEVIEKTWIALLETQGTSQIQPIGLGARDTLRLEACYLLYGSDMNDTFSPLEAGISWATKLAKSDFVGKAALVAQKSAGITRSLMAFRMLEDGIPRHDMVVYQGLEAVGKVTSGSVLPTVGGAGGLAYLDPRNVGVGAEVTIDIRGKRKLARLVEKPLYKAKIKG